MSESVSITAGSGTPIAVDLVSSLNYQIVKLDVGGDGLTVPVVGGQRSLATSLPVALGNGLTITGPATQTATANNILDAGGSTATDASGFASGMLEMTSTGTGGTWIVEQSVAGTTWNPVVLYEATVVSGAPINAAVTASATTRLFRFAITAPLLRVRIATTITGGSIQARAFLSQVPFAAPVQSVVQATAANLAVNASVSAGTAVMGAVTVVYSSSVGNSASVQHFVSAATTNATSVKASAGRVFGWSFGNNAASWRYAKIHATNVAPTAGSGVVRTIAIPPGGVSNVVLEGGFLVATGIGVTIVTGAADSDATATGANEVVGELFYI